VGFRVLVGGAWPHAGDRVRHPRISALAALLTYIEAILRVYNRYGRRDNIHKARIKILVKERGPEKFREEVECRVGAPEGRPRNAHSRGDRAHRKPVYAPELPAAAGDRCRTRSRARRGPRIRELAQAQRPSPQEGGLRRRHAVPEEDRRAARDVTVEQMEKIADLADRYSFGELASRTSRT